MDRKEELSSFHENPVREVTDYHKRGRGRLWKAALLSGFLATGCLVPGNNVSSSPDEFEDIFIESWASFGGLDGLLITASCVGPHVTEQGLSLDRHLDVRVNYEGPKPQEGKLWLIFKNEGTTQEMVVATASDPQHLAYEFHGQISNIRPAGPMDAVMGLFPDVFYTVGVYQYPDFAGVPNLTPDNRLAQISFVTGCPTY
ncbi:hypothetical protein HYU96_02825 [Candidatus Daviesbacteria bacterium]|nr:hypothetical protein [Candidatus Daviesbacteria bacterium]